MGAPNTAHEITSTHEGDIVTASFRDIGQTLAEARKEQNLTIKQVASKIHIRQQYLMDLEEGNLADLPGRVYILGFIRTYARLLNLDGEELIRRINRMPNVPDYDRSSIPLPMHSEESPSTTVLIISGVVVFFAALGGYFFLKPSPRGQVEETVLEEKSITTEGKEEHNTPIILSQPIAQEPKPLENKPDIKSNESLLPKENIPPKENSLVVNSKSKIIYPKDMPEVLPVTNLSNRGENGQSSGTISKKVTLKATEPAWVEVRDESDRVIFMKVMRTGEEYSVPEKPGVTISTGNSGGIDIFVGEKKLPSLGVRGVVKRGIRVDSLESNLS